MSKLNMPSLAPSQPVAAVQKESTKPVKDMVNTSLRFPPKTLATLKKIAIDRGVSLQAMIEIALYRDLQRDGITVPGLRNE